MIQRVIVGIDFSEASRTALATAKQWAGKVQVPMMAIHAVHLPGALLGEAYPGTYDPEWVGELEKNALAHLRSWVGDDPGIEVFVATGSPEEILIAAADPHSLLVVGQVGHSAIEHLFFGSTAARVVRHAPCDVLVVRREKGGHP